MPQFSIWSESAALGFSEVDCNLAPLQADRCPLGREFSRGAKRQQDWPRGTLTRISWLPEEQLGALVLILLQVVQPSRGE